MKIPLIEVEPSVFYGEDEGSADQYVVNLEPPITAYVSGLLISVKIANTNTTTTPTLNVNNLGAKTILKADGSAIGVGQILEGQLWLFMYNGTNFVLVGASATDSDMVDGFHASQTPGANIIPVGGSDGRIPWGAKPAFRGALVKLTANKSINPATVTAIPWDASEYDTDSIWSSTNPTRLTVPSGITKVRISANITMQGGAASLIAITTQKNGAGYVGASYITPAVQADTGASLISPVVSVTAGDYFEVLVYHNDTVSRDVLAYYSTWFTMEIIE